MTVRSARIEGMAATTVDLEVQAGALTCQAGSRRFSTRTLRALGPATLIIPGRIERTYSGPITITAERNELTAAVTLPLEDAVAAAVAAETPSAPEEALKAQAVLARSYYAALHPRHGALDFCDTTHCQFLRETPHPTHPAALAAQATRGILLLHEGHHFGPMYFRSCAGRTLTAAQVKLNGSVYPYHSVACEGCSPPSRWEARITREEAAALPAENARLELGRKYGWNRIASNSFEASPDGDHVILRGTGEGHGLGLCQRGAAAMARAGRDYRVILAHYFPRTNLKTA